MDVGSGQGLTDIHAGVVTPNASEMVSGIPLTGAPVYVLLSSQVDSTWWYQYAVYPTANNAEAAELTAPAAGSTLEYYDITFQWNAGTRVTRYQLDVGSGPGLKDIHAGSPSTSLSETVSGIPLLGDTLYVRLWSEIDGAWQANDGSYPTLDPSVLAALTYPPQDARLNFASVTFLWNSGVGVEQYRLEVGSSPGGNDLHNGAPTTLLFQTLGLPQDGSTVYVRLWSLFNGAWLYTDSSFQSWAPPSPPGPVPVEQYLPAILNLLLED